MEGYMGNKLSIKKFQLYGFDWKVKEVSPSGSDLDVDGVYAAATVDFRTHIIAVNQELTYKQKLAALGHEIVHIVIRYSGMGLLIENDKAEEDVCEAFGAAFGHVLQQIKVRSK